MDPIDSSFSRFKILAAEIATYDETLFTEQDTRVKVIDRILVDVLDWPLADLRTESPAGAGFVDYLLLHEGLARCTLEAKKDGTDLGLGGRSSGRAYVLGGPAFTAPAVKGGIDQAIRYCAHRNTELACLTNGREWVVFRGSRLGDGHRTLDGVAFVFTSLEGVADHFALFFALLYRASVLQLAYRAHFQEAEGLPIRAQVSRRALRQPESRNLVPPTPLAVDIDRVMTTFFRRLTGDDDPDMLADCFVVTRESVVAEEGLARISEELLGRIRSLETANADELTALIQRSVATQRNEFVLIVGTKGAGKSTFIERFFRHVLPPAIAANTIVAKVNLYDSDGDEATVTAWLNRTLLLALEDAVFPADPPTYEELQGMFFDEYTRWMKGPFKVLYDTDHAAFQIKFGEYMHNLRTAEPHQYIKRLIRHIVRNRKHLPCMVFDNADHFTIEFQERVFQYARSIYENELCLIILPITDRTSWQLLGQGTMRSFESEALYLPTPMPRIVLSRRVAYIDMKIDKQRREAGGEYFFQRGIRLSLQDLSAFTATLHNVFLRSGTTATWISLLANMDIRRCLDIARHIVTSPALDVEALFAVYVTNTSNVVPLWRIKKAMILGKYDIYPAGDHSYIYNIYALSEECPTSPLLGLRILQALRDRHKTDEKNPFVSVDQMVEYCREMLFDPRHVLQCLNKMLECGLCLSYDPTHANISVVDRVQIAPAGYCHLQWGIEEREYIQAMLQVCPMSTGVYRDELIALGRRPRSDVWHLELISFLSYLVDEDARFCMVPKHVAYASQANLRERLLVHRARLETGRGEGGVASGRS